MHIQLGHYMEHIIFLSIVDHASRGTWVYLMKDKSEASKLVMSFCMMVRTQFNVNVNLLNVTMEVSSP